HVYVGPECTTKLLGCNREFEPLMTASDRRVLVSRSFRGPDIPALRAAVSTLISHIGLLDGRRDDFVLAVDEILTNAVRHGGGSGRLEVWTAGDCVWFQVLDAGPGMSADSQPAKPTPTQIGGRGLWLARQLTDQLSIFSGRGGTTVV